MKNTFLKFINLILIISFTIQIINTILIQFKIGGKVMFELHEVNGYIFLVLGLIHLILNFNWIKKTYLKLG